MFVHNKNSMNCNLQSSSSLLSTFPKASSTKYLEQRTGYIFSRHASLLKLTYDHDNGTVMLVDSGHVATIGGFDL